MFLNKCYYFLIQKVYVFLSKSYFQWQQNLIILSNNDRIEISKFYKDLTTKNLAYNKLRLKTVKRVSAYTETLRSLSESFYQINMIYRFIQNQMHA